MVFSMITSNFSTQTCKSSTTRFGSCCLLDHKDQYVHACRPSQSKRRLYSIQTYFIRYRLVNTIVAVPNLGTGPKTLFTTLYQRFLYFRQFYSKLRASPLTFLHHFALDNSFHLPWHLPTQLCVCFLQPQLPFLAHLAHHFKCTPFLHKRLQASIFLICVSIRHIVHSFGSLLFLLLHRLHLCSLTQRYTFQTRQL